jgi:biotin carboxyl carrier protein
MDDGRSPIDDLGPQGLEGIVAMNVDVMVNGRPWKVAVERAEQGGTFTVTIKGTSRVVDASWIDADTLSLIDAGTAREIRIGARDTGAIGVEFGGKLYEAVISRQKRDVGPTGATGATGASGAIGAASVKAPMPGRVVRVLVAVGDLVTAKQAVVVVEAMKMENELRTPREGVVKEVLVEPGAAVETGAVLIVVDQ